MTRTRVVIGIQMRRRRNLANIQHQPMHQLLTKIIQTHAQRKILVAIQVQTIIRRVRKCLPVRKSVRKIAITKIIAMEAEKRKICAAVATEKCFPMKKIFFQVLPDQKQKVVGQQPKTD